MSKLHNFLNEVIFSNDYNVDNKDNYYLINPKLNSVCALPKVAGTVHVPFMCKLQLPWHLLVVVPIQETNSK